MHAAAKQRIAAAEAEEKIRVKEAPTKLNAYETAVSEIEDTCAVALENPDLSEEERDKIAWLKSRIDIEM